jgi:putative pyridoxal-dependent aspartate 1-decarboxylase
MTPTTVTTASPIQREIWRQSHSRASAAFGCTSVGGAFAGRLDEAALRGALEAQFEQHAVLRSDYQVDENGILCFAPQAQGEIVIHALDWESLSVAQVAQEQARLIEERAQYDWQSARALFVCARLSGQRSWVSLALPSMNADIASVTQILQTVLAEQAGAAQDAVQYFDIADWLNDLQVNDQLAEARDKWDQGTTERAFSTDFGLKQYRAEPNGQIGSLCIELPAALLAAASSEATLADRVCASLRMSMAACSERAILARSIDLRAGALVGAVGALTQIVPLAPAVAANLADAGRNEVEELARYRDFAECYARPARAEARAFPFLFSHVAPQAGALHIDQVRCAGEAALLHCILVEAQDQASLVINYDRGFITEAALREFVDQWQDGLPGASRWQRQACDGARVADAAGRATVLSWFDQVAAAGTGRIVDGAATVALPEVERRANRVANYLIKAGLAKGAMVALHLASSVEFVVAMLGVLKAGGVYVPIDIGLPSARVAAMLAECVPAFIIHAGATIEGAEGELDIAVMLASDAGDSAPSVAVTADDLAYVLYTSGSTGAAKGICVRHDALVNHMAWMIAEFGFAPHDVFMQRTSVGFDASIWEFWSPLLAGATMLIAPREVNHSPAMMARMLAEHGVSVLQLVPSLLAVLLEQGAIAACGALRQLFLGGEALPAALAREAALRIGCEVVNLYGPSECCIQVTFERFDPALTCEQVPIGQPINNVSYLVLRADGEAAAPGQEGELLFAGRCLFGGYHAQPALTAEALAERDGVLFYKTGDWVRVLPDHKLYFIDRKDQQIKHNGYRIELGEISRCAQAHGLAAHAVCTYDKVKKQLCLFVIAPERDNDAMLAVLRAHLPEYMVPSAIIGVAQFPRLSSGKIDLKALASQAVAAAGAGYRAPATPLEATLAAMWTELLALDAPAGVETGFFTLGGDSLLAMRLTSRICERFDVDVKMRSVFENDTIRKLAAHIGSLGKAASSLVRNTDSARALPLSFSQRRLWLVDQLEEGNGAYNVPKAFRLRGALDVDALKASLAEIIARHQALRTRVVLCDGEPVQQVQDEVALPFTWTDLGAMDEAAQQAGVRAAMDLEVNHHFDLGAGLLLRAHVIGLAPDQHVLLLNMHHIVSDGWSQGVFMQELGTLYGAHCRGQAHALAPLEVQYADFAIWQRDMLDTDGFKDKLDYWKTQLDGLPEVHNLPLDFPRAASQGFGGATRAMLLDQAQDGAIARYCQQHGVTLFMFLQSALAVLLSRYSNESDVVIGSPISGRMERKLEPLLGCFVNNLVIRNDLSANPRFADFLARAKQVCLDAQANQEVPFDLLVEQLNPERSLSYNPLFQIMLVSESAEGGTLALDGLAIEPLQFEGNSTKFDLLVGANRSDAGLALAWTYNTGLFAAASVERMAANFAVLLGAIVAQPDARISELPLLSVPERAQLLHGWNATDAAYPDLASLQGLFEEQAAATPHAPAIADDGVALTYAELNARANQLAHHLLAQGLGADALVGLCMQRSVTLVVAMLAILKAGAAYVPLDPDYPAARLAYMLADAQVALVLTESAHLVALPAEGVRTLCLDTLALDGTSTANPAAGAHGAAVACAIYTSGSTGEPKAVLMPHRSIVNRLHWMRSSFPVEPHEVFCQKTSLNFVDHVAEIFQPLTQGTPLVVIGAEAVRDIALLVGALQQHRISRITLVPSMLDMLVEHDGVGALGHLRYVISSGEPLGGQLAARVKACLPQARLLNIYGSTEVGADVTCAEFAPADAEADSVSIGRPIANNQAYVLDAHGALLPLGAKGELHIGGAGLAQGYLNQPGLSAERFVAHPFSRDPQARLYRTGDIVRWMPDGRLSYLGRKDHQVKLRGMRIETGEVEAQLCRLAAVKQAVVMTCAVAGQTDEPRLVAYVVGAEPEMPAAHALRQALKLVLPDYMVPAVFIALAALPLTKTGKLDRKALPAPSAGDLQRARYVAPRNATEASLCRMWEQILKLERVGIDDNFFASGGHSLLAMRLLSQIRQQLEIALPLRALFEQPTIGALCATLASFGHSAAAPIPKADRGAPLALSFAQQRLWFIDRLANGSAEYNLPLQFELKGNLDVPALRRALQGLVERHEVLRTSILAEDGQAARQLIRTGVAPTLLEHDLRTMDSARQMQALARLTGDDAGAPFNLSQDVLLRARLFRLADQHYRVFLNVQHIAADGWSLGILFRELNALYNAFSQGQASPLAPLALQYADYAQWQRANLQGALLEGHLAYWRAQLDQLPALHGLPLDKQRPARQRFKGKAHGQVIGAALLSAIEAVCQREQVTLFMFLQTAFAVLLKRYSNETDIVMGSPIAGRTHRDVEPVMGLFVNNLVLRSDLSGDPEFKAQLQRNKQMVLAAYEHQEVPFEMLVEQLQPERSMSHSPLFQISLTLQNVERQDLDFHGLSVEHNVSSHNSIKCDLELTATEGDGQLCIDWTYNVDLFARASIERMVDNFEVLLRGIVAQPDARLSALPVLSEAERERLLHQWNDTDTPGAPDGAVHALFEAQAAATPDAPALTHGKLTLSYAELNARANRLAHQLTARQVGADSLVGLCMERSATMVVAMLAIMKAGAAYLPLDPDYPSARLAFLARDAGLALILTESAHLAVLAADGPQTLCLDDAALALALAGGNAANPVAAVRADAPACVIYTSGSTGEPKGVLVPHRSIVNRMQWMRRSFPVAAGEVFCQKTPLNFVDHVAEVFQPLTQGTPLVLIDKEQVRDVGLLIGVLQSHRISRITLVPSLLSELVEHEDASALSQLRYVISSGEPLSGALAARVRTCLPQVHLVNLYGSTEVGADVTCCVAHTGTPNGVMQYFPDNVELAYNMPAGASCTALPLAMSDQVVTPDVKLASLLADFSQTSAPESTVPFERYLSHLNEKVMPHVVNVASRKFIGHMTSQLPNFMGEFARLITIMNQNMVKIETSKSLTLVERQAIAMVHRQFFDLPEQVYSDHAQTPRSNFGLITSGGTTSNITAMLCARNKGMRALGYTGAEIAAKGAANLLNQAGLGSGVIIGSRLAHYSIRKAAGLLGIGEENILLIEQGEDQKLSMPHLVATIERCRQENRFIIAMIGMGGATETGTIDPLFEMAQIAKRYAIHFHVDAAWGGAFRFSSRYRNKLKGIESADSVTFCAHKQMYLPQGISIILFRNPEETGILPVHTAYQAQQGSFDTGQHTLEGSRPAIALMLHAALHLLSRQGYGWLVDQSMEQAAYFTSLIEASGAFELVGQPEINIVNYRYIPVALRGKKYSVFSEAENEAISAAVETIQQEQFLRAKTFVSKTRVLHSATARTPVTVFRVVFSNPLVSFDDLRDVLHDQLEVASLFVEDDAALASLVDEMLTLKNHLKDEHADAVPLGTPIDNMRVYLLDQQMQLLPQGARGEVYVGGPGLALGYLNRPELTSTEFVANPFSSTPERLYKTGDMARWLPGGSLQFSGRADAQCKLRGMRVELGEIEAALQGVAGVNGAVVQLNHDLKQLVAYVVLDQGQAACGNTLRGALRRILPDYMLPELFVFVDSFAMTVSGKIDRKRLPAPLPAESGALRLVAPRSFIESELCDIWQQILKRDQVGVKCNFFEMGGHSLLAMTVINHIKKRLGIRLPLVTLFEYPDIEGVANVILALSDVYGKAEPADADSLREDDIAIML